ncbi:MAG: HAD family hydrolase [Candidatus Lloydbacteria bacterium]|nr:HAD family hydrolase [Candidatus Lloydbacteria bacterium]
MKRKPKNKKNGYKDIKVVILDWDGVIGALGEYFLANLEAVALQFNFSLDPIRSWMGDIRTGKKTGAFRLRENIKLFWPAITQDEITAFVKELEAIEKAHPYPLLEGSKEAILRLRKEGVVLALCTANSTRTLQWRFASTGIHKKWFKVISNPDTTGVAKPHPFALQYILNTVGVSTKQALFIGDWAPDLEAAKAAGGVPFIGVTSGSWGKKPFLKAGVPKEKIFDNLSSFVDFFLQQRKS